MDAATILTLGAALLGFGSLSLFLVRSSNHDLKGLGWLGVAFACGSAGAALLMIPWIPHPLHVLLPDLTTLLAFVFLQVAVSELLGARLLPRFGLLLLVAITVVDLLYTGQHIHSAFRITCISLTVALQCGDTGRRLWQFARERKPAIFCSGILFLFSGFNLGRALLVSTGLARRWHIGDPLMLASYVLYIAVGLGLAFGFFWMTNARLAEQLEELAGTDPLTRISNRRTLLRACEKEMGTSLRRARPFSILMADLDHFKRINDRFGHEAGDEALLAVVETMQNSIRGIDVLGRWGGEEFVVLLPNASEESARIVAERMRSNVERMEIQLESGKWREKVIRLTISIGLATFEPQDSLQTLFKRADEQLYLAKDAGRNRVLQGA